MPPQANPPSRSKSCGRRTTSSLRPQTAPLCVEQLETRTMLDASATLAAGILSVTAGNDQHSLYLSLNRGPNELVLTDSGKEVGRFASANVSGILIDASAGSHSVKISQEVLQPAIIQGGAGNIVLQAGGGPTKLIAGSGRDVLIGGTAADILIGGPGNDVLIGTSGHDVINPGSGNTKVIVRGNDSLVGAGPQTRVFGTTKTPNQAALLGPDVSPDPPNVVLMPDEVKALLQRAAVADPNDDGIVAVVDRSGRVLGVRVMGNVSPSITGNPGTLSFAIDGAISEARTGAFFANDQAPLTSRTVEFISQSTITQREVDSNPNILDPNSTVRGPGYVAPIGIGGHFPPNVAFTPQVDLFQIEGTNRDSSQNLLAGNGRFNVPDAFLPNGTEGTAPPDAYGVLTGLPGGSTQNRGIGTLPGGVPIYKKNPANGQEILVGGIGVFFPGKTGYASEENSKLSSNFDPTKPDRSLEAEAVAIAAVGGSAELDSCDHAAGFTRQVLEHLPGAPDLPQLEVFVPPPGRIDLVGITLDIVGPNGRHGPDTLLEFASQIKAGSGNPNSGMDMPVDMMGDLYLKGQAVPEGFLVTPHDASDGSITAAEVTQMINQGIAEAKQTRAAIRLPLDSLASMAFAVADKSGNILGLYRMPDATIFSIDVAVAKARNVAYYDDPSQLKPIDQLPGVPAGVAFTNRTFRYLAEPFFPEGINGQPPAPFSILNDGGTDPRTGLNVGPPLPASAFTSVLGHDAFNPGTNFRQDPNKHQNGIVFFPGSSPLYKNGKLVGGLGVSGDGVDEDDVVTVSGATGFGAPASVTRADQVLFQGVRLPYQEFNRNPLEPV